MYQSLVTMAFIVALFAILAATRVDRSAGRVPCENHPAGTTQAPSPASRLPRVTRNRWERRDLARTLMADDDYVGRISDRR